MSGYQQQPPPPKHTASSYSSNSDPFNNPHQLNYDPNAQYAAGPNPYATGGPNPGAGGAGVAPPGAAGQYAPYYDNQPEMENRYEGGGMGRETWASESGWSANGTYPCPSNPDLQMVSTLRPTTTANKTLCLPDPPRPLLPNPETVIVRESPTLPGRPRLTSPFRKKRSRMSSLIWPTNSVFKKTRHEMYTTSS